MEINLPRITMTIHRSYTERGREVYQDFYEGEPNMSQQQLEDLKQVIGDGQGRVTVSKTFAEKDFGTGGDVFVSVSLACDQSHAGLTKAIDMASYYSKDAAMRHHTDLKQTLVQMGIIKPVGP